MREDLPAHELQDLHPVTPDGGVPERWARSVDRACTIWLLERGLIESVSKPRMGEAGGQEGNRGQEDAP